MMNTKKIEELLSKIKEHVDNDGSEESKAWFKEVQKKASKYQTEQEELEYLQGILNKLETKKTNISAIVFAILGTLVIIITAWYFLTQKANAADSSTTATVSSTISSVNLPKEDFQVIDYKVDGENIVYNSSIANTQHKVFANGSVENSLSANAESAVNEMVQYMSHNATALKEKAMTFGIVNSDANVKDWLEKKDGRVRYNEKGKDIYYQTKAFLSRSQISSKKMEEGSNYYATGVDNKGNVVVSEQSQDLSGQQYVEVKSPEHSTEKYTYCILNYCGNTVMQSNNIPGVKKGKVEIPTKPSKPGKPGEPGKPGKPSEPSKPSESKVEKKDPSKDPANQGKAPVGGGKNDGSSNGSETSQVSLPEQYSAPAAPSASAPASSTTPSQDARVSEPSQWSGAGEITDSNGTTKVTDNGAVTTPDGRHYDDLVGKSAPAVEAGTNGVTTPSSSANFTGSSMSQPGIDD